MKTPVQIVTVSPEESGQKLFAFLRARTGQHLPEALCMRVVRTGQVRIDGRRCKPFDRVLAGQTVRIPPLEIQNQAGPQKNTTSVSVERVFENNDMIALHKPSGLPVHGGSGWTDSLRDRLAALPWPTPFIPVPVHRLDRDTSGIVLCAKTHACVRAMHAQWQSVTKAYLCWVQGVWPWKSWHTLTSLLEKKKTTQGQRMVPGTGKTAITHVLPVASQADSTLLLVVLGTGRTHQIRVHLAQAGHAIYGDGKYGTPGSRLLLHATMLRWPGQSILCWPDWQAPYTITSALRQRVVHILDSAPTKEASHV